MVGLEGWGCLSPPPRTSLTSLSNPAPVPGPRGRRRPVAPGSVAASDERAVTPWEPRFGAWWAVCPAITGRGCHVVGSASIHHVVPSYACLYVPVIIQLYHLVSCTISPHAAYCMAQGLSPQTGRRDDSPFMRYFAKISQVSHSNVFGGEWGGTCPSFW